MIKNILKYFSVIFVFALSGVILYNSISLNDNAELSETGKLLRHFAEDHKFNEIKFKFIEIETPHLNFTEEGSGPEMTITAAMSLFLISSFLIIKADSFKRYSIVEKFLFTPGFRPAVFQPPKYLS